MALSKTITTQYGVDATYWKIVEISCSWLTKVARIRLAGYTNKDSRDDNCQFLMDKFYNVGPLAFDEYFGSPSLSQTEVNPVSQGYEFVKTQDTQFADALDV